MFILQFAKTNPPKLDLSATKLAEEEDVTEEAVSTSLRRAISLLSTRQAHDGHWPADYGGPMFLIPGLVFLCYVKKKTYVSDILVSRN